MGKIVRITSVLFCCFFVDSQLAYAQELRTFSQGKKGIGASESKGFSAKQLQALNVAWYYNWGAKSTLKTSVSFVPMIFSKKSLAATPSSDYLLGFNEPDNQKQANLAVEDALSMWPVVKSKAKYIGAPAMAGNAIKSAWLKTFSQQAQFDFITVHWYKGADSQKFIHDIKAICEYYKKPVWVTEYAPVTAASAKQNPDKYRADEVQQFIQETVHWMIQEPCVQRFAWHDPKVGTSALFLANGELSPTGEIYAEIDLARE